jgi:uncharacterized membrane protein
MVGITWRSCHHNADGGIFAGMDNSSTATTVTVDPRLVSWTHWMYGLHALAIAIGVLTSASIVGKFIFGLPSIIAVIMNYLKRSEARGTWLEPHFSWQLRTFWLAALACLGALLLFGPFVLILIGIIPLLLSFFAIGIWATYRIARGWLALRDGRTLPA